jgi:hypothetical protein
MNQLFEEFIAEFIRRELREVWQVRGWTFHAQSGTRYLLCDDTGNNRFKLVPDIRFETDTGETARSERIWLSLSCAKPKEAIRPLAHCRPRHDEHHRHSPPHQSPTG